MTTYTYGDCVYFNTNINLPKEHYNKMILNQEPDFYIPSLSKLMDETFTTFTKLFMDIMIKNG